MTVRASHLTFPGSAVVCRGRAPIALGLVRSCAVGADLAMPPDVEVGSRPLPIRVMNAYPTATSFVAEMDPVLTRLFPNVTGLDAQVRVLFAPSAVGTRGRWSVGDDGGCERTLRCLISG